jgi:hypothetical protein
VSKKTGLQQRHRELWWPKGSPRLVSKHFFQWKKKNLFSVWRKFTGYVFFFSETYWIEKLKDDKDYEEDD